MKKIIAKPHLYFFGLVPIFIIISFISGDKAIDISIYDTYYVVLNHHICLFSATFFAMIGINYFSLKWANKPAKKWLTIFHLILQTISLIPFLYALFYASNNDNIISNQFLGFVELNIILVISFLIFIFSILIHIINFFSSLLIKIE